MTTFILPFEKMHGLGNDFIMLEKRHLPNGVDGHALARLLCDRNFAIGADGLILVDFASSRDADFSWDYYNKDGSEAEMCGNGMRCFAKYVFEKGFTESASFSVQTKAGIIKPSIESDGTVTVNMGTPKLSDTLTEELTIDSEIINFTYVEVGNPHAVIFLKTRDKIPDSEFFKLGPIIEKNKRFPSCTNVEFVNVINKEELICRVWERGCGPTLACGTGACAALVASSVHGYTDDKVKVHLPGGCLNIHWDKKTKNVFLNGPATFVYTGQFNLDPKSVCVMQRVDA